MSASELQTYRQRAAAIKLSLRVWADLAASQKMKIYEQEVSNWTNGRPLRKEKIDALVATLVELEALVAADAEIRIDLTSVTNIRAAQKRLDAKRQSPVAVAPWQYRGAVASPDDSAGAVSSASGILAGAASE